ncbi:oxidoreductase [Solemya pervernicosa gill symbiont]|uniref:Oxidoreductase n=1 Tax=Solemya pervernicosa gill symbiont TaxID=642797 RepID=A0A1T2L1G4_9GAMM|nr:SDR family NAD(P)-dependent oxidoreductase [Solemya pervernicosa gill symbiont]OOZ38929.1 oxidoreductase [Solemya pervernicosa gill symbiont]
MKKTILITGSTDGIGLEAARMFVSQGHHVLLHGRNPVKLQEVESELSGLPGGGSVESYLADLSRMGDVETLAKHIIERSSQLDVLINNAGIFRTTEPTTQDGLDVRFVVNTIAPYLLTKRLLPLMTSSSRVINLSSAAQSPVNSEALYGRVKFSDELDAYAQSKLALTMWSRSMALSLKDGGPIIIAVNPGSMLATKMVKEGFGVAGNDIDIGAEILFRVALTDEFETATGQYFDNDRGQFSSPHPDALNPLTTESVVHVIEEILAEITP